MKSREQVDLESLRLDRRALLVGGGAAVAGLTAAAWLSNAWRSKGKVFIARNQRYDGRLSKTIRDGLLLTGVEPNNFRRRRVLLKPNMVEPCRNRSHMTTHPAMVVAATEVFRDWGAEVSVGEAPGHVRDTDMALVESGILNAVRTGPST